MKKLSPRAKFIEEVTFKRLAGHSWDAMTLASNHDPEHAAELKKLAGLIYAEVKLQDRRFAGINSRLVALEQKLDSLTQD